MAKQIVINVKSINVYMGEAPAQTNGASIHPLLAAMLGAAQVVHFETEQGGAADTPAGVDVAPDTDAAGTGDGTNVPVAAAPAAEKAAITTDNVLVCLHSDPRYTKRSIDALLEYFQVEGDVELADLRATVEGMVVDGRVRKLRQRGTNKVLYMAVAPTPVSVANANEAAPAETTVPELNAHNVHDFLRSHPRHTKRTVAAIAKHFGVTNHDELQALLDDMDAAGDVDSFRRRSDGVTLYSAA